MTTIVEIAVFSPLRGSFSYIWPESLGDPQPGLCVMVPFGRSVRGGLVLKVSEEGVEAGVDIASLKSVIDGLDASP